MRAARIGRLEPITRREDPRPPQGAAVRAGILIVAAALLLAGRSVRAQQPSIAGSPGAAAVAEQHAGTPSAARFYFPCAVAVDAEGNLYVADSRNHAIRKVSAQGVVTTLAGAAGVGGSQDGSRSTARFWAPYGVAIGKAHTLYVADKVNYTVRAVSANGEVTTLAGGAGEQGVIDGSGSAARFFRPSAVAVDAVGTVYVADGDGHTIRRVTPDGVVTTLAGAPGRQGSIDGIGDAARFHTPEGLATDAAGNVYVADFSNHAIRKVTPAGKVATFAGLAGVDGAADGTGSGARFTTPAGVATDKAGNIYVADTGNHTIRKIDPDRVVSTLAGLARSAGSADGAGSTARFDHPWGVAVDPSGTVYVADMGNHTIRKVTPNGVVTTLAGMPGTPGSSDGAGAAQSQ